MRHTLGITVVMAVVLGFSATAFGESASVLLEKGIFKEETAGDLDAAIKIYKQIVEDANANRKYVAEAHYRLGRCHLKKGDKDKAAEQFRQLVGSYADQKALAAKAEAQLGKLERRPEFLPLNEVVERTVYDDGVEKDCFIDLDTGKLHSSPKKGTRPRGKKATYDWLEASGIDAYANVRTEVPGLCGFEMIVFPISEKTWKDADTEEVAKSLVFGLTGGEPGTPALMLAPSELPRTYAFKTREGSDGVLQILDVVNKPPRHIKIRYKLLKGPERRLAPGDVMQISVLDLLQDGREAIFRRQVSGSGVISLPGLPKPINVQGMTQDQVRDIIVKAYAEPKILRNPSVSVMILGRPADLPKDFGQHRLAPGDVVKISVLDLLRDGQEAIFRRQVSGSGVISLPGLPKPINVQGMTQDQLRDAIVKAYAEPKILTNPSVSVMILGRQLGQAPDPAKIRDMHNVRQTVKTFLNTLATEKPELAYEMTTPEYLKDHTGLAKLPEVLDITKAEITEVLVAEGDACVVTSRLPSKKDTKQKIAIGIGLGKYRGKWLIRDIDTLPDDKAKEKFVSGFKRAHPDATDGMVRVGTPPNSRIVIHDNSGVDLDSGNVTALIKEWPDAFDLVWDNDEGGILMRKPKSSVRMLALPDAKSFDQAVRLARKRVSELFASKARGVPATACRYLSVLTDQGKLAVIQIGKFDRKQAVIEWSIMPRSDDRVVPLGDAEETAAAQWLFLVDQGKYAESWDEAAAFFKAAVTKQKWAGSIKAVRAPLGKVKSRKLLSARYTTSLPGAPDGEYVVIQYQTSFENKKDAVETITPMKGKDGKWRVSGYYIK